MGIVAGPKCPLTRLPACQVILTSVVCAKAANALKAFTKLDGKTFNKTRTFKSSKSPKTSENKFFDQGKDSSEDTKAKELEAKNAEVQKAIEGLAKDCQY